MMPTVRAPSITARPPNHRIRAVTMVISTSIPGVKMAASRMAETFASRVSWLMRSNSRLVRCSSAKAWMTRMAARSSAIRPVSAPTFCRVSRYACRARDENHSVMTAIKGTTARLMTASRGLRVNITTMTLTRVTMSANMVMRPLERSSWMTPTSLNMREISVPDSFLS